jgi:hypothetical protein
MKYSKKAVGLQIDGAYMIILNDFRILAINLNFYINENDSGL